MEFIKYNPIEEEKGCVPRALSKAYQKDYNKIKQELIVFADKNCFNSYNEIDAFETYILMHEGIELDEFYGKKIKDLDLENGTYVDFCNDKDYYHMTCIINNILYDKDEDTLNLKTIKLYKIRN